MKVTVRIKLFLAMSGIIVFFAIVSWQLNSEFLNKYYLYKKENYLVETYHRINGLYKTDLEGVTLEIEKIERLQGMYIAIYNSDLFCIYETMQGKRDLSRQIFGSFTVPEFQNNMGSALRQNQQEIDEKKHVVFKYANKRLKTNFLNIMAQMNNGDYLVMALPVAPIEENVEIAKDFYLFTGLFTILLGGVIVLILTKKLTKPIVEVNELSEKMSRLDFSSRYEGKSSDEIGQLGKNINQMAIKLEQTISELKFANEKLLEDIEMERRIDSMRKEFISNVSHELKTPISLIQGYSEGLKLNVNDNAEDKDFYCEVIIDETAKMNRLVRELLDLSQIEYGNIELDRTNFNICELIEVVLRKNSLSFEEKEIKLVLDIQGKFSVNADYNRIEQVFTNYLNNAINHIGKDKLISIKAEDLKDYIRVSVFNTGDNIPKDSIDKVWTSFYKVDKARTREYGGTGLGLSIVKAIQELHGTAYGVENLDNGVNFWFDISKTNV